MAVPGEYRCRASRGWACRCRAIPGRQRGGCVLHLTRQSVEVAARRNAQGPPRRQGFAGGGNGAVDILLPAISAILPGIPYWRVEALEVFFGFPGFPIRR